MHPDLLRTQKNSLYLLIEQHDLLPSEFSWKMDRMGYSSDPCPVLWHKKSNYYFLFCTPERGGDSWQFKCAPGTEQPCDSDLYREGWPRIQQRFKKWCSDLKDEVDSDDLWATVKGTDLEALRMSDENNNSFTYDEAQIVEAKIQLLIEYVRNESVNNARLSDKQDIIIASLKRLEKQAKSGLGRIDWSNQLVGVVFNIVIAAGLTPERAGEFLRYIKTIFTGGINLFIS